MKDCPRRVESSLDAEDRVNHSHTHPVTSGLPEPRRTTCYGDGGRVVRTEAARRRWRSPGGGVGNHAAPRGWNRTTVRPLAARGTDDTIDKNPLLLNTRVPRDFKITRWICSSFPFSSRVGNLKKCMLEIFYSN